MITSGGRLAARHVIHTVGPIWQGGGHREDELLAACYRHSLSIALRERIRTIAFPAISTGVYRFPLERAASIAANEVDVFLGTYPQFDRVIFCCFGPEATAAYRRAVDALDER